MAAPARGPRPATSGWRRRCSAVCRREAQNRGRRETAWIYSQGDPGVFPGDTYYYGRDHNLTGLTSEIDTSKVAVHLLTGEYDRLADEDGSPELARQIPGATYTMIPGLGHFGPSEHPELLKCYLLPVPENIRTGAE